MEASKLKDLIKFGNYWRYVKKGIAFSVLLALLGWIIRWILALFNGGATLKVQSTAQFSQLSGTLMIAFTLAVLVAYITTGFAVEYISNSVLKLFRWVNK